MKRQLSERDVLCLGMLVAALPWALLGFGVQSASGDEFSITRSAPDFSISRVEPARVTFEPKAHAEVCACPKGGDCLCGPGCDCYQPVQLNTAASATSNKTWTDKNGIPHYSIPVNDTGAAASSPSASGTTRGRVDSGSPQAAAPTSSAAAAGSAARYARPRARSAAPAAANCPGNNCGTMQRRGVFGLRRGTQPRGVIHW